ncbi:hypothetical protein EsDP_00005956 [Epichloe bromicola]|uniref:triacylglycerol lipase n=1 Tax=Epichloe bromicola TaxID=79588 RepID=A0ABQ0CW82_9HYPO
MPFSSNLPLRTARTTRVGKSSIAFLLSLLTFAWPTSASGASQSYQDAAVGQNIFLPPAMIVPQNPESPQPAEHTFTLRHIYHHGTDRHPGLHRSFDITHDTPRVYLAAEGANPEHDLPHLKARSRGRFIERLVDRRPSTVDPMVARSRQDGYFAVLDASAWTMDEVPSPDITDKGTVLSLAYMAADAYVQSDTRPDWEEVGEPFNRSADFGWQRDGLRGHIWADDDNSTVVIGLKGTSPAVFDGDGTTTNDKINDNLFFSCCCAQQGQWTWHQVCDCATGTYACNNTCVSKALMEESRYYGAARELYANVTERYPNSNIWVVGHSLGGAVSSLLGLTYGLPVVTFEAVPEALAATRLGLPIPPGSDPNAPQTRQNTGAYHFGHTADPIYIGACNGATASCSFAGYALETTCHTGSECVYDVVADKGWRVGIGTHKIRAVISDVILKYDDVPECDLTPECRDCALWRMYESNEDLNTMETESKTSDRDTSQLSDPLSDLDSLSDSDSPVQQTEWLATTRKRRATAGNRMKSILTNEEPDSDLELLFAEDENDQGFSDVGEDGSDVQMDSSSDDEDDENANAEDLEGEKELERQAKAKRAAQRKRKAQEAIPAKFRKKVRIDPATTTSPAPAPAPPPPPKKKSERMSWLPSTADLPTRASSRKTTRISKEQLHLQMAEREARRLKQVAQMEKKAARLEAMKKPPMTQEERLAEASNVEKRNSKSLNRWEEAERQREEERKAKLAALNQRTLKGPVITFWSGKGQWDDLELRSLRPYVTEVEEKPKKKKEKADRGGGKMRGKNKYSDGAKDSQEKDVAPGESRQTDAMNSNATEKVVTQGSNDCKSMADMKPSITSGTDNTYERGFTMERKYSDVAQSGGALALSERAPVAESHGNPREDAKEIKTSAEKVGEGAEQRTESTASDVPPADDASPPKAVLPGSPSKPSQTNAAPIASPPSATATPTMPASGLAAPPPPPPIRSSLVAPSSLSRPCEPRPSGVPAPVLAPPPGMDMNESSSAEAPESNKRAPPTISLSDPILGLQSVPPVPSKMMASMGTDTKEVPPDANAQPLPSETAPTSKDESPRDSEAPAAPPEVPRDMNATRNAIIYQNFNEIALRDKSIQTQILFGRKMTRLPKPTAPPICVITNNPARYRDPKTGLPFYNVYAYRELQRLYHGDYKWSRLLGAWVGSGRQAAKGVPERFVNPSAGRPKTVAPAAAATDGEDMKREPQLNKATDARHPKGASEANLQPHLTPGLENKLHKHHRMCRRWQLNE